MNWKPSAEIAEIRARAQLLTDIRHFFSAKDVLEVETPLLSQATITDPFLFPFTTDFSSPFATQSQTLYLQTSPEYAMKRLLCAGIGDIFQICKAFRNEESGHYHNPEFSILEWYRIDFDHHQLMSEVDELLQRVLACLPAEKQTYQEAFEAHLSIDPLTADLSTLKQVATEHGFENIAENETDIDVLLQLLFSHCVEPKIGQDKPIIIYGFPASQAALARLSKEDPRVAERFEVYFKGIELANGFHELKNPQEQRERFENDIAKIKHLYGTTRPIDENLLSALENGLPDCSGVALGIDRLLMLKTGASHIKDVLTMSVSNA
ncbi:elongation factor P--(R)-beta-lysine ligase [Alteromonadaceae bacterium M269]|nr:elongation factor P--(R)-beta-lysine ligase [Alteromonadaceae bacterium M269]